MGEGGIGRECPPVTLTMVMVEKIVNGKGREMFAVGRARPKSEKNGRIIMCKESRCLCPCR